MKKEVKIGEFGPIYAQFKNKPKDAILFLKKKKNGECLKALHRQETGFVDIVWGKNDENNRGYGLKHIIEKHEKEIQKLGFEVEEFIPMAFQLGTLKKTRLDFRILIENEHYRVVILTKWKERKKTLLLTSFGITQKKKSKK
ncbi:MAG: hypothetical protein LBH22_02645 [Bacteroidales bacterium]|jgi:hypothetical protein|nr:hypothetical protein [Bacteroidales bacterium]